MMHKFISLGCHSFFTDVSIFRIFKMAEARSDLDLTISKRTQQIPKSLLPNPLISVLEVSHVTWITSIYLSV